MIIYWLLFPFFILLTVFFSSLWLVTKPFVKDYRLFDAYYRVWIPMVIRMLRIRIHVHGLQHVNDHTGYVYIANHTSYLDIPVLSNALPGRVRFAYRHDLAKVPIWGWALRASPFVRVFREDPRSAVATIRQGIEQLAGGASVIVFPEGTRSADGSLAEFKRGATMMAVKAKAPVVPVVVKGAFELLPKDAWTVKPGHVHVYIGEPILPEAFGRDLDDEVRRRIQTMLASDL